MAMFVVRGTDNFNYSFMCYYCTVDLEQKEPTNETYTSYDNMEEVKAAGWDFDGAHWCCPSCCEDFNKLGI